MKVSIVIPVYNVENYIERCFTSLVRQKYTDLECIFVDDCSPDNSVIILENLISKYVGPVEFKVLHHTENKGLSCARNTGLLACTGEYLFYLDSDDDLPEKAIQLLADLAVKYPQVQMIQGNTKTFSDAMGVDWRNLSLKKIPEVSYDKNWIQKFVFTCSDEKSLPVNSWNKLFKKSFVLQNQMLFKPGVLHEDFFQRFYLGHFLESIAFCKEFTYNHYVVPGSIMSAIKFDRSFKSYLEIIEDVLNDHRFAKNLKLHRFLFCMTLVIHKKLSTLCENEMLEMQFVQSITKSFNNLSGIDRVLLNVPKLFLYKSSFKGFGAWLFLNLSKSFLGCR